MLLQSNDERHTPPVAANAAMDSPTALNNEFRREHHVYPVSSPISGSGQTVVLVDTNVLTSQAFYRIHRQP
jgi:hypothetical protein